MKKATTAKELNAVIVGSKDSHKHLVQNIILGRNDFNALDADFDCERGEGEVCEHKVTIVQTTGWWRGYELCDTAELFKTETILSVTLCPPGLHGFLLVINAELPFKDVHKKATKKHMEHCFGEKVWDHTVVVFSHRGDLDHETIEDYISDKGEPLQSLLEACGNRYHVLCVDGKDNSKNVRQLIEKIDNMVAENSCYEIETARIQSVQERRKEVDKRAEELHLQSQQKRQKLRSLLSEPKPHLRILIVGWVLSGKSGAGDKILNHEAFHSGERTVKVSKQSGQVAGREVVVVDTPGWWKFFPAALTPSDVMTEILAGVPQCSPSPNVILLVVPISTSFTEEQKRITVDNMKIFGHTVWRHVIVLFTFGDTLGSKTPEQHIESEGKPLRWLIEKCGKRYHVIDNTRKDDDQVIELLEKMDEMVAGNSCFNISERDNPQLEEEKDEDPTEIIDESKVKEILNQFNIKWDYQDREEPCLFKGDSSMEAIITFSEDEQRLKDFEGEEEHKPECANDAGSDFLEKINRLMEREWLRREASLVHLYKLLADRTDISEPDHHQLRESREKVRLWQQTCATSGYQSASVTSRETEEDNEQEAV